MSARDAWRELEIIHADLDDPPVHLIVLRGIPPVWDVGCARLKAAFARAGCRDLVVDYGGQRYFDDDLLVMLLHAHACHRLVLVGPVCATMRLRLDMTGTSAVFTVRFNLANALAHLRSDPVAGPAEKSR